MRTRTQIAGRPEATPGRLPEPARRTRRPRGEQPGREIGSAGDPLGWTDSAREHYAAVFRFALASRNGDNRWHVRQTIRLLRYYRGAIDRLERENVLNLLGPVSTRLS